MALRSLTAADLPVVERWFGEPETRRWLGDEAWPRRLLALAARPPDRFVFIGVLAGDLVGLADVERYGDDRAAVTVVVAPEHRCRGIGKAPSGRCCRSWRVSSSSSEASRSPTPQAPRW